VSPYEVVDSEKAAFPVSALCEAVGVSRSAYYAWCRSTPSKREVANERLLAEIRAIHSEHEARYGSPRMHDELRERGHEVGKHRVARLMRENGIQARVRRRFRHTTDSNHRLPVATNLLAQRFTATAPNQAWVGDITYIWTAEGWAYLAVLLDLFSRRVVGWALRKSLSRDVAVAALEHALTCRRPPPGLVHHSDRGSQYASYEYRLLLTAHGAACSMSAAGNCYDNAVAESFFATLKKELVHGCAFETRTEAYDAISHYIENYYNAKRRHSAADNQSPINFELAHAAQLAA
jgi:transposase InsO family protein